MWLAIIVAGATVANSILLWILYRRISQAEVFLMLMSGTILNQEQEELIRHYVKARHIHPSGKKP